MRNPELCAILLLVVPAWASPRLPEVVYPVRKNQTPTVWEHAVTQNGVSKEKMKKSNSLNSNMTMSSGPVDRDIQSRKEYNDTSLKESRVVLAPVEGKKVYTLEKYTVSSESDEKRRSASNGSEPQAKAEVKEMSTSSLRRTTMSESSAKTTSPPRSSVIAGDVQLEESVDRKPTKLHDQPKHMDAASRSSQVRIVSHDTSSSSEVRFPAQQWQLPPSLFAARLKQGRKKGGTSAELTSIEDKSYEHALELYSNKPSAGSHSMSMAPKVKAKPKDKDISAVFQKTFGETKPKAQMTFVDRKKFRATFASHANLQNVVPLPPAPFSDESGFLDTVHGDMDLLGPRQPVLGPVPPGPMGFGAPPMLPAMPTPMMGPGLLPPQLPPQPLLKPSPPNFMGIPAGPMGPSAPAIPVPIAAVPQPSLVPGVQMGLGQVVQSQYAPIDPNYKLDSCCRKQGVSNACQAMCNFDTFTDRSLVTAVLSNQCPGPQLGQAFDCASSKVDHTECCQRNNLHLYNGGQCMPFCRTHEPTPPNIITYVACLQVFDTIKNCYREYQYQHPNIFGD